ncbi:MAG: hypothetical protein QNK20_01485 [Aureibaculum sp.]|nr:hypothetical protein [Aureibaculum sp.]
MEKGNDTLVEERINGKHQGYEEMVNLIGIEGSLINLLFSIKKYINLLSPLEVQYYKHVKIAHARKDDTTTIEDVNQLYKILQRVRSS